MKTGLIFCIAVCGLAGAQAPADPELPRVYVQTAWPAVAGRSIAVNDGENLQAAIDGAQPGDEIVLEAGATWKGNFILKQKPASTAWITIRSSGLSRLLSGRRASPLNASVMARILTPNASAAIGVEANAGASRYRLAGLEIGVVDGVALNYVLVGLGSNTETSEAQMAADIVVDRSYIHGAPGCFCKRGIAFNGIRQAVIDSYISDIHSDQDAQAAAGFFGPGPFKIVNNYLEASGENVMFGGADPTVQNLIPSDIEIRKNYFFKPLTWKVGHPSYAGRYWTIKNLLELKNAQRVLVDGNVFENSWAQGQSGPGVVFKSVNQDGGCPWCVTEDVTFSNNIVKGVVVALVFNGTEIGRAGVVYPPAARRISISNLLAVASSQFIGTIANMLDVQFSHVTAIAPYKILSTSSPSSSSPFLIRDSILERAAYGVGSGSNEGKTGLNAFLSPWTWTDNMLINTSAGTGQDRSNSWLTSTYPPTTSVVTGYSEAGFVNFALGAEDYHGYALTSSSPGRRAASDGKDLGVDFAALEPALAAPSSGRQAIRGRASLDGSLGLR